MKAWNLFHFVGDRCSRQRNRRQSLGGLKKGPEARVGEMEVGGRDRAR